MSKMANPMIALREIQQALNNNMSFEHRRLSDGYIAMTKSFPDGGRTYSYAKIIDGEIQTLSIFGTEDPFKGISRYSLGYAVTENHRGRGLSIEALNKGIEDLKLNFGKSFYIEALIDQMNIHSINVAKKLFPAPGVASIDEETGTPALLFYKLITI